MVMRGVVGYKNVVGNGGIIGPCDNHEVVLDAGKGKSVDNGQAGQSSSHVNCWFVTGHRSNSCMFGAKFA